MSAFQLRRTARRVDRLSEQVEQLADGTHVALTAQDKLLAAQAEQIAALESHVTTLFDALAVQREQLRLVASRPGAARVPADVLGEDEEKVRVVRARVLEVFTFAALLTAASEDERADLRGADLYGADLHGANLYGADWRV